jgi:hypothetical protein
MIFWGPVTLYFIPLYFWQASFGQTYDPQNDILFWLLLAYGIFFFPIGVLAFAMFDSAYAFNPFLWIGSIFSTFFHYCGLILFFCLLTWLFSRILVFLQESWGLVFLFAPIFIYSSMIAAHLLGRFHYLNAEKLNWDV